MSDTLDRTARNTGEVGMIHSFLIGSCPDCEHEVLTARELNDEELIDVCLHCSHRFATESLQWVSPQAVAELGYAIDGYDQEDCDSHGGCRDGSCGVRQPQQ